MRKEKESRQRPRSMVNWPVTIKTSHRTISGETRDVSPGGAFIYCDRPMPPNHIFFLSIHIHSSTVSLSCMAESIWSTHGGMGVRFDYDNPEQGHLLAKFILGVWNSDWKDSKISAFPVLAHLLLVLLLGFSIMAYTGQLFPIYGTHKAGGGILPNLMFYETAAIHWLNL